MSPTLRHRIQFVVTDFVMTSLAWLMFNVVRFETIDSTLPSTTLSGYLRYDVVMWGQLLFPVMMMGLYWLSGFYNNTFRKSRLEVLTSTVGSVLLGTVIIYFVAIIDDPIPDRYSNYALLLILGSLFLVLVFAGRMAITSAILRKVASGKLTDRVIVVGDRVRVRECMRRLTANSAPYGMTIVGAVYTDSEPYRDGDLEELDMDNISAECKRHSVAKVIIAVKPDETDTVLSLVKRLYHLNRPILLPVWSLSAPMTKVRMRSVAGIPLADLASVGTSDSTRNVKRLIDVVVSVAALLLLSPVMVVLAVAVKRNSKGGVFYSQKRIGLHCRPFNIYKFRTMYVDAEADGVPQLSRDNDPRVTSVGRILRKYRLDELPQFWNVLKGDMSLVGPRPEREYFEARILEKAPHYTLVHQIKPGITSLGMVKYGYATTVDQMVERLAYDMLYLENVSVSLDIKIMFFTVRTVLTGRGV